MVVDRDVVDRAGRVLVPGGATLTARSIKGLLTWGVVAVEVRTAEVDAVEAADPEQASRVARRFRGTAVETPIMAELHGIALQRT